NLLLTHSVQVYGQGSGVDCRRHVQKLNLLQGEAEEALGWTSWYSEERAESSRWSKYLDQESEDQEDEEEAALERQQFCSQRKNTVGEQRAHQKRCFSSDVPEHAERNGVCQLVYQAKKHKKCFVAVSDGGDKDSSSGGSVVPAISESVAPEENTQPPTACTKPSKWGKFLSSSDNSSENAAAVTMALQEGSGGVGLDSTAAGGGRSCSGQAGRPLPQGRGFEFKQCVASREGPASRLPHTSCSVEDAFKEPQNQLLRAGSGSETTTGRCCLDTRSANTLVNSNPGPKLSSIFCEQLFCTGEDFDDNL
ncbi:MRNIP protein, partial [Ptilonorhynchus violaceus]|nr:MRNIP protein [Ptilonorhynchus violaceus]